MARVSGEAHTACAPSSARNVAASDGDDDSPPAPSRAAQIASRSSHACRYPLSLSGWSTCETISRTSRLACASFHFDSPCRMKKTVFIDELWRRQRNRTNDSRSPARGELTSLGLSNLTSISLSGRVCSGTRAWPSTVSVCEAHSSIRKCAPESETPTASWRAEFHTGATVLALVGHEMMPPTQRSRESTAHITTCTFGGFSPGDNRLLPTRTETRWIVGAPDTSS
mmetsp:Transcript_20426/g.56102  ORF Transcript_20426/g.56102 Transcript_20426/m.56102 type:complete len:226 (+) Transcript_20426:1510-2187(+)